MENLLMPQPCNTFSCTKYKEKIVFFRICINMNSLILNNQQQKH